MAHGGLDMQRAECSHQTGVVTRRQIIHDEFEELEYRSTFRAKNRKISRHITKIPILQKKGEDVNRTISQCKKKLLMEKKRKQTIKSTGLDRECTSWVQPRIILDGGTSVGTLVC
jgi:hypothetical protein